MKFQMRKIIICKNIFTCLFNLYNVISIYYEQVSLRRLHFESEKL